MQYPGRTEGKVVTGNGRAPEIIFANWREILHGSAVRGEMRRIYERGIEAYLDYCRLNGQSVTTQTARDFMSDATRRGLAPREGRWEKALNWFFREGKRRCAPQPEKAPSVGRADLGKTGWERRMIERLRLQHYSWRTEQTYREWARRFAVFLRGREMEQATDGDLKGFLTELAVKERVSVATQRQALNALIFLYREGLGKLPGD